VWIASSSRYSFHNDVQTHGRYRNNGSCHDGLKPEAQINLSPSGCSHKYFGHENAKETVQWFYVCFFHNLVCFSFLLWVMVFVPCLKIFCLPYFRFMILSSVNSIPLSSLTSKILTWSSLQISICFFFLHIYISLVRISSF
jgi:hypothetical protein